MQAQERAGADVRRVLAATLTMMGRARQNPNLAGVFTTFSANSPQIYLEIDRQKALEAATIEKQKVVESAEIVKQQEAFFLHGVAHLRPMTLRQVADAIEMHESTVSRVTSNKYLSCARGLFELKYFFTSSIQSSDGGDAVSAEAVKSAIRALITAEEPKAILSDDTLVDMLNAKGFGIARRTVAKYREAMGIGSSVQRRRQKALEGVG